MTTRAKRVATHVRWMVRRDLPGVIAAARANGMELTGEQVEGYLRLRNVIGMVAEAGDEVVGFMVYRLERDALVLMRFAVLPGRFGRTPLVEKLLYKVTTHKRPILAVPVAAECRTDTVRQLCRTAGELTAVAEICSVAAILADALQDAECRDEWLLTLLRAGDFTTVRFALAVAHGLNRRPE